jgi:hypothetical protein
VGAWVEVAAIEDTNKRQKERKQLSEQLFATLHSNREQTDRGAEVTVPPNVAGLGERLGQMLLKQLRERS